MSVRSMANQIRSKVSEDTTQANIAFLPSGFATITKALKVLARMKGKWNIDILDSKDNYTVKFGEALNLIVPKIYWASFKEKILKIDAAKLPGLISVDLTNYLKEELDSTERLLKEIEDALYEAITKPPLVTADEDVAYWKSLFGGKDVTRSAPPTEVMILDTYDEDVKAAMETIKAEYGDDEGYLSLILSAIKTQSALDRFKPFSEYDTLISAAVISKYLGVTLRYDVTVGNDFKIKQKVHVDDEVVAEGVPGVKVTKDGTLYPIGTRFQPGFFRVLRNTVKDLADSKPEIKGDENEREAE